MKNMIIIDLDACSIDGQSYDLWFGIGSKPQGSGIVLFQADSAENFENYRGVVTGNVAADGSMQVVFTQKGSKPIKTWVAMDDYVETGDHFAEIIALDTDENGTWYAAYVEY